jgi:hypothetical protein
MTLRRLCLLAALAVLPAAPVRAQDVRISGDDRSPAAQLAREILARRNYVRIDRDTILPASFRAPGDLVVYDAEVRLEGTVEGSVAVIGGDFFIRPRARIGGNIAVIGGGVYTSALATTGQILYPNPRSQVALEGDSAAADTSATLDVTLTPPRPARLITFLPSPYPSYDRVNGLTASIGARILPTRSSTGPRLDVWGSYRQENPDHAGGGVRADVPLGTQNLRVVGELSRATRTNDAWIRNDLSNSIAMLLRGADYRNYYDADRASLLLTRPVGKPLIAGESWLSPRIGVQWERARSLETQDVWSLFEGDNKGRENPPVLEGDIVSALVGADLRMQGRISGFSGGAHLEAALPGASDAEFTQALVEGTYETTAFRTHLVEVYFRGMMPLSGDPPPQRFGILGGSGTLPTAGVAEFRGDHLAFIEAVYAVPITWIELPYLGIPNLEALYATGAAWESGEDMPGWIQNPGVGLAFTLARVRLYIDPANQETKLNFSFSIPRF